MFGYPNKGGPWAAQEYNENLSTQVPDSLSNAEVNYWFPEAGRHIGLPHHHGGDLVSPLMFWHYPATLVGTTSGIETNGRRY